MTSVSLATLAQHINATIQASADDVVAAESIVIHKVAPLDKAQSGDVAFFK